MSSPQKPVSAPGARAPSLVGCSLWPSLFTRILFRASPVQAASKTASVWPIPLPYPKVLSPDAVIDGDTADQLGLNLVTLVLSFLHCDGPKVAPLHVCAGSEPSPQQWAALEPYRPALQAWNRYPEVAAADMGRGAVKVEGIADALDQLLHVATPVAAALRSYRGTCRSGPPRRGVEGHPAEVIGSVPADMLPMAKSIEPSRLSFHGTPSFDPMPFLDPANRAWYADPIALSARAYAEGSSPPRVQVRCPKEERMRPANQLEPDDRWIQSLGSIFQLRTLFLRGDCQLVTFAEDIKDFYYGFTVPEPREIRNFFGGQFKGSQFRGFRCYRPELADVAVCPCLSTLAMGDKRAVAYGQAAHLSVALRSQAFALPEFISLKASVPRSGNFSGLMIDDFIHCAQVPLSDTGASSPSAQRLEAEAKMTALRDACEQAGLPRHPDKAVWGKPDVEVWGSEILGKEGFVCPNCKRSIPLIGCVAELLSLQCTTVRLLEVIAGSFVAIFQFRRRLMSLLSEVYSAQSGRKPTDIVTVSRELHQELLIACILSPTAFLDIRAPAAPVLDASDASSSARASVCCTLPSAASEECYRHTLQRGLWSRLLRPLPAYLRAKGLLPSDQELPEEHYKSHPLWQTVCESLRFEPFVKTKVNRGSRHINILELQAALEAEAEARACCGAKVGIAVSHGLKRLRAKFTPSFTKLKDSSGKQVPHADYPHKAADYLQTHTMEALQRTTHAGNADKPSSPRWKISHR